MTPNGPNMDPKDGILPGLAVTTRMQHPVSSPINRMPGSDFKKNFFFKALLAEGPE